MNKGGGAKESCGEKTEIKRMMEREKEREGDRRCWWISGAGG